MKCIVIETSPERTSAHIVTDDNGTPHIYATVKEARAELKANGYSYNRANARYYLADAPEYRAYIIREDSEEYADAIEKAIAEQIARQHTVKYISREGAEELHTLRADKLLSWYEIAQRYGITEHQARKAYRVIHYSKPRVFEYDTEAERVASTKKTEELTEADTTAALSSDYAEALTVEAIQKAVISTEELAAEAMTEVNEAMSEASEAERKTIEAAIMYDAESAAAFAAEARSAADRAEFAAKKAACMDPTTANIVSEEAAFARAYADRATDTAQKNAAELEERAQIIDQIEDPQHREYIRATAKAHQWTPDETRENIAYYRKNKTANAAALSLLEAYAESIGEHPTEDDPETRAAYRVARDEIIGDVARATEYDRETVELMTEAIARSARRPDLSKYESMQYLEIGPATYQRHELEAYLGEPDDYDADAIEAEATAYDPVTGRRIWVAIGDDLAAIAERHQIATYYAI